MCNPETEGNINTNYTMQNIDLNNKTIWVTDHAGLIGNNRRTSERRAKLA
jgi:hypothetical protein